MAVKIQPQADYVVAQSEEPETKTASGFYLPDKAAEKPKTATVIAVGKDVEGVEEGDKILYKNEYEATKYTLDSKEYVIVFRKNIVATVK